MCSLASPDVCGMRQVSEDMPAGCQEHSLHHAITLRPQDSLSRENSAVILLKLSCGTLKNVPFLFRKASSIYRSSASSKFGTGRSAVQLFATLADLQEGSEEQSSDVGNGGVQKDSEPLG